MISRLRLAAHTWFRRFNAPELLAKVSAGRRYEDGMKAAANGGAG